MTTNKEYALGIIAEYKEQIAKLSCEHLLEKQKAQGINLEDYCDMSNNDEDIYQKIYSMQYDEIGFLGCYMRGHCDLEQWIRVSTDWLKTECGLTDKNVKYLEFKKGYAKPIPRGEKMEWLIKKDRMRGSTAIMVTEYY